MASFQAGDVVDQLVVEVVCSRSGRPTFSSTVSEPNSRLAGTSRPSAGAAPGPRVFDVLQVLAQYVDRAGAGLLQQDHLAQQRGLARAAAANDGKYLSAGTSRSRCSVHRRGRQNGWPPGAPSITGSGGVMVWPCQRSSRLKAMENRASATITRKMDCTTLRVVLLAYAVGAATGAKALKAAHHR
jgi:hypothetical protein